MAVVVSADPMAGAEAAVLRLAETLRARRGQVATAESCTGGLIAAACTAVAGSSDWFERGVVSYSNGAKTDLLGVPAALVAQHGAVSREVAAAMAEGLLARTPASVHLTLAVTGIAGPGGGSPGKPVGTVWLGWAVRPPAGQAVVARTRLLQLSGDRSAVRWQTVLAALTEGAAALS